MGTHRQLYVDGLKFRSKLLKEDRLGSRALSLSPGEEELNDFSRYSFSYRWISSG